MGTHALERLKNHRRFHIDLTISEAFFRPCISIMHLIRMEHDHLTRYADPGSSSVGERLDASSGQTNRIGVVTVLLIGMSLKACFEEFYPVVRLRTQHPIVSAQSFKTKTAVFAILHHINEPHLCEKVEDSQR